MSQTTRLHSILSAMKTQWRALGGFGKVAVFGVALSMIMAVALGFIIPGLVRADLVDGRSSSLASVVGDLVQKELLTSSNPSDEELSRLDDAVRLTLLGGDTVRVKVWDHDGTIIYSDATALIGESFPPSVHRTAALAGDPSNGSVSVAAGADSSEAGMGSLIEYYVPVRSSTGEVIAVFEVYERADPLDATVASIRRDLSLAIAVGLVVLGVFMISLTIANAKIITRRTREVEGLLSRLSKARDEEQTRIVGALHDDIGPPLYRILYGIQGVRSMLGPEDPFADELERIEALVNLVETSLRTELSLLHHGSLEHLSINTLLQELVEKVRDEGVISVDLDIGRHDSLSVSQRTAVLQAATEALSNVRKHASAEHVSVRVREGNGRVLLDIDDDGIGVSDSPGLGLTITQERLEMQGGGITVANSISGGTLVRIWVPTEQVPVT